MYRTGDSRSPEEKTKLEVRQKQPIVTIKKMWAEYIQKIVRTTAHRIDPSQLSIHHGGYFHPLTWCLRLSHLVLKQ